MTRYRVRDGHRHGGLKQHGPGDVVELSEQEAAAFLDKLERVEDETPPATVDSAPVVLKQSDVDSISETAGRLYDVLSGNDPDAADDLTEITGIGHTTQETLNGLGVRTYADLMAAIDETPKVLKDAIRALSDERMAEWREEAAERLEAE